MEAVMKTKSFKIFNVLMKMPQPLITFRVTDTLNILPIVSRVSHLANLKIYAKELTSATVNEQVILNYTKINPQGPPKNTLV